MHLKPHCSPDIPILLLFLLLLFFFFLSHCKSSEGCAKNQLQVGTFFWEASPGILTGRERNECK